MGGCKAREWNAPCLARLRLCKAWNVVHNASQWLALNAFSGTVCGHTWPQSFKQVSRRHTTWNILWNRKNQTIASDDSGSPKGHIQTLPAKCNLLHDDIRHHQEAGLGDQCDSTEHRACARSEARTLRSLFATHTCSFTGFVFSRHNQQIVDSRDSLINRAQGSNLAPSETFALYLCSSNKEPYHTQCNANEDWRTHRGKLSRSLHSTSHRFINKIIEAKLQLFWPTIRLVDLRED